MGLIEDKNLENILLIGDKVLIKPNSPSDKTKSGLYLPPTVKEKEKLQAGYIVKVGPGYPIPTIQDDNEPWMKKDEDVKYIPLQAIEGDLAVFLNNSGFEIEINNDKYLILNHSSILMIKRDEGLMG